MTSCFPRARRHTRVVAFAVVGLTMATLVRPVHAQAAPSPDRDAVRRAVLDYVEGFYEGDSLKLARAVRPEVFKYGFWKARDSTRYAGEQMKYPEFFDYARGVKKNNRQAPPTAAKVVELFDVQDQTASAKLTASWGTDYLLLGKYDGNWMISSVMWQGPRVGNRE